MIFVGNGQGKELSLKGKQVVEQSLVVSLRIKLVNLLLEVVEGGGCLRGGH